MEIIFTGRHEYVDSKAKSYVEKKLERTIRNIPKVTSVHVIIDSERFNHKVEVVVHVNHQRLRAADKSEDLMASIDLVLDKLSRQLKKYKDKLQAHRKRVRLSTLEKQVEESRPVVDEDEEEKPQLIRTRKFAPKPMDANEAMMQLKLSDDAFLVFFNAETNRVSVVYKMKDEHFGLIEP